MSRPAVRTHRHLHGRDVAYVDLPGEGTPVLLVHGIGSSADTWGDVPHRLSAQGIRTVALDLPGHGESSKGRGDYSLGSLASTIRDLLDELGLAALERGRPGAGLLDDPPVERQDLTRCVHDDFQRSQGPRLSQIHRMQARRIPSPAMQERTLAIHGVARPLGLHDAIKSGHGLRKNSVFQAPQQGLDLARANLGIRIVERALAMECSRRLDKPRTRVSTPTKRIACTRKQTRIPH